ncbi:Hypothetical predicted protein [Lynx pardinus]|uniref:HAP1 N-terminal domain-containing protein n=1 Tax=Lynx pardinus TaxID=191816 RepID=A0A485MYH7_LYNPA|nr:Hypothetical predicted protein [Lynx pardinus]
MEGGCAPQRERDLNTAARIGQSLVRQNSVLMGEHSKLEAMLGSAREDILHLRYQVSLGDDLLQLYSDSEEEEEEEEEEEPEEEEQQHYHSYGAPEPTCLRETEVLHDYPQLEALQEQLRLLEEENKQLRRRRGPSPREGHSVFQEPGRMTLLPYVASLYVTSYLKGCQSLTHVPGKTCRKWWGGLGGEVLTSLGSFQHGAETEKLQQQLASERVIQMLLQHENLQVASQLQDLQEKYTERGGMLTQAQEEVKTLRQQAPGSADPVTRYTHAVPLEALPGFQEALGEELRRSIKIISDPVFFMERWSSDLGCSRLCRSEVREQDQGLEAEKGLLTAEDFVAEDFVPVEELVPEEERGGHRRGGVS